MRMTNKKVEIILNKISVYYRYLLRIILEMMSNKISLYYGCLLRIILEIISNKK